MNGPPRYSPIVNRSASSSKTSPTVRPDCRRADYTPLVEADLPIDAVLTIPGEELRVSTSRSGGPGGQGVNTTDSRVTLRWNVRTSPTLGDEARMNLVTRLGPRLTLDGDVMVSVSDERSQLSNRETARERLAALVRAARIVQKARRPTRPSRGSKERRLTAKKSRGDRLKDRGTGSRD